MKNKYLFQGIFYTSLASIFWGLAQPLYFNQIKFIPAIEIVSHRTIWSFFFLFIIIFSTGKIHELLDIFRKRLYILFLSVSGILITCNWTGFIIAVNINRVQDASMGYYISPIISIFLGYIFFKEKISILKILSLLLMLLAIIILLIGLKTVPYLAIFIGLTWAFYGLIRKKVKVSAAIGLLYESGFISIFAIIYLLYLYCTGDFFFLNYSKSSSLFLFFTGAVTIFPLFFFNLGIKNIPLGLAGVIFYLVPTFHFLTSILILKENLSNYKLISFIIIWIAVTIFIYDKLMENKKLT